LPTQTARLFFVSPAIPANFVKNRKFPTLPYRELYFEKYSAARLNVAGTGETGYRPPKCFNFLPEKAKATRCTKSSKSRPKDAKVTRSCKKIEQPTKKTKTAQKSTKEHKVGQNGTKGDKVGQKKPKRYKMYRSLSRRWLVLGGCSMARTGNLRRKHR
jgi:hypothetical protein